MILSTHSIVGGTLARFSTVDPFVAITLGFLSHFVLDSVPHWDYSMRSKKENDDNRLNDEIFINKDFAKDMGMLGADVLIAIILLLTVASPEHFVIILLGALGGILPDALQFFYFKLRIEPFVSIQRFHQWIHTDVQYLGKAWGPIYTQASISLLALLILFLGS
jgi:hypothetical protein